MFLDGTTFAFVVEPARIGVTLAALAAITLLSAYLPARRAASMRPADALRANN